MRNWRSRKDDNEGRGRSIRLGARSRSFETIVDQLGSRTTGERDRERERSAITPLTSQFVSIKLDARARVQAVSGSKTNDTRGGNDLILNHSSWIPQRAQFERTSGGGPLRAYRGFAGNFTKFSKGSAKTTPKSRLCSSRFTSRFISRAFGMRSLSEIFSLPPVGARARACGTHSIEVITKEFTGTEKVG